MNKLLFLPDNYKRREQPEYFNDVTKHVYQPEVYPFAEALSVGFGANKIIDIGCGTGSRTASIKSIKTLGIDYGENLKSAKASYPDREWIEANFENDLSDIKKLTYNGLIICSDVIEHLINPLNLLKFFQEVLPHIYGIVISTPERDRARGVGDYGPPLNTSHVAEWTKEEFYQLLVNNNLKPLLHGYTRSVNNEVFRNTQVAFIPGGLLDLTQKDVKVLAIVPCFNEVDIITQTIDNLLAQKIDVHVLDNWSTDGTWEELQKYKNITLQRFPEHPEDHYNFTAILTEIDLIGCKSDYDWIMHVDADEQIESVISNISIKQFIGMMDSAGFDVIDLTHVAFRPTTTSISNQSLSKFWQFSEYPADRNIQRAWKNRGHMVHIAVTGGHSINIACRKSPINLILKHYPLRSPEQAKNKIFKNRLPRFAVERKKGWHFHYDAFKEDHKFIWDESQLNFWNEDTFSEWVIELATKIGINYNNPHLPKGFN